MSVSFRPGPDTVPDAFLELVTVGLDDSQDAASEFARSVQIVSRLPDHDQKSSNPDHLTRPGFLLSS